MKIKMTDSEKKIFDSLDEKAQKLYLIEKDEHRKGLMLKCLALNNSLQKTLDSLAKYGVNTGKLKEVSKPYRIQLVSALKSAYNVNKDEENSKQLDEELTQYLKESNEQISKLLK